MTADAWATALSVLGPEGLTLLPTYEGVEALVVSVDERGSPNARASAGFSEFLVGFELELAESP
jgi:thiamine biosynthesis lipoprotein ApbE